MCGEARKALSIHPDRQTGALTVSFINTSRSQRSCLFQLWVWSPLLRQWRQQMLTHTNEAGGLWQSEELRHTLWGAPSWSCPLTLLLPWLWTLVKTFRNEDYDQMATSNDGLSKALDSTFLVNSTAAQMERRAEMNRTFFSPWLSGSFQKVNCLLEHCYCFSPSVRAPAEIHFD